MAQLGRPVRASFADVNTATARVRAPEGCVVVAQAGQGCCGALMLMPASNERRRQWPNGCSIPQLEIELWAERPVSSSDHRGTGTGVETLALNADDEPTL